MALPTLPAIAAQAVKVGGKTAQALEKAPPAGGKAAEEEEEPEEGEEREESTAKMSALLSPEGILMMSVGGLLDILSIIAAILILAFGVGLLLAKIIYIVGLIFVGTWAFFRSGKLPVGGKGEGLMKKGGKSLLSFLKRQWPKLTGKAIPAIGDALPLWTWTVYSELTSG